ncbi:MAG: peptidoglycan synthetase [Cyclobacteriaceae bacterium]|nr:peptidoglycan synthetase [Cyclobacteriaceae bacterium]
MPKPQRIHFIAIGGSVMHNLAIALKNQGHTVTGSDDEIFEPSRSALDKSGLLPKSDGWNPALLDNSIDAVILGMHAKKDNPELLKAQQLGLKIYSFPEYIYNHSIDKQRVIIAGSHGKTTITGIVVHVLNFYNRSFDYVIGARIKGVDNPVKLSDAPLIVIEGDEYLCSALDPTPKFLRYQHHIGLISGVAWDHANVFPTEEEYLKQFDKFADQTPKSGILIFCDSDPMVSVVGNKQRADVISVPYKAHSHALENGQEYLTNGKERIPIKIFGNHNLQNINGAKELLKKIGISSEQFYKAISSFEGAAGRLEKVKESRSTVVFKDYAHAPSKVKASVRAVKELYPTRDVVACLELHTFSSLNKSYLPQYKDSLKGINQAIVFFNPEKVKAKNLEPLTEADIKAAFGGNNLTVFDDAAKLEAFLAAQPWDNKNLLMMSSGNFAGFNIQTLAEKLLA